MAELKRQTATADCPKSMIGRVIGKNGETIKALQTYSGALIQIDQTVEPTKVTISGTPHSLSLAVSMVTDIVKGTFKGFALLRQITNPGGPRAPAMPPMGAQPRPVYAPGYGLIPPSQLYGGDDRSGVVGVDAYGGRRPQQPLGWQPAQVTPSQVILGLQPGGMMRPISQQQAAMMAPGMQQLALQPGEDMMAPMAAYAPGGMAGMAYAYPADYAAMQGMLQAQADMMYQADPSMMGAAAGAMGVGAQARLYGAAGAGGKPGGMGPGSMRSGGAPVKSSSAPDVSDIPGAGGQPMNQGGWVQAMDPEGKVYYYANPQ